MVYLRGQNLGKRRDIISSCACSCSCSANHLNDENENTEQDRNEFIRSFHLNMLTSSSPILVRNDIRKLDNNCYSARVIRKYFQNSNAHNENIHIKQIWKVHNVGDYAQFIQNGYDEVDNMLLWHGTTRSNLVSILQNSWKLPVSATNGHIFGPGIYFADRISKSAECTDQSGPEVFLLCQVALGRKWRVFEAKKYTCAPRNFNTLKAVGKYVPDINGQEMLGYCKIPCGQTVMHRLATVKTLTLRYNEYIVFDQDRIRIKFIVHCERGSSGSIVAPVVVAPRPVSLRSITNSNSQNDTISRCSTIKSSNSGLMNRKRYNAPSPRPAAAANNNDGFGMISDFGYKVFCGCSKFLSSDFYIPILIFLIAFLASSNFSRLFYSTK